MKTGCVIVLIVFLLVLAFTVGLFDSTLFFMLLLLAVFLFLYAFRRGGNNDPYTDAFGNVIK